MNRRDKRRQRLSEKRAQRRAGRHASPPTGFDAGAAFQEAVQHQKAGNWAEAEKSYRQVLAALPGNAAVNANLAVVLRQKGEFEAAAACCRDAIRAEPGLASAHATLGALTSDLGRPEQALGHFDKALSLDGGLIAAHVNMAIAFRKLARYDAAEAACLAALESQPGLFEALNTLGAVRQAAGDLDGAADAYRDALANAPNHPEALTNLGSVAQRLGDIDDAIAFYEKAIAVQPDHTEAHNNLGAALKEQERFEKAALSFRRALEIDPGFLGARNNLGTALASMGDAEAALAEYDIVLASEPNFAEAHLNRGNALFDLHRLDESIAAYGTALAIDPDSAETHLALAIALLAGGDLEAGWTENEWRWQTDVMSSQRRAYTQPQWDGGDLDGRALLVWSEQGLGDEIMFALCLPDLLERVGIAQVVFECDDRLAGLFRRTYPGLKVAGRDRQDARGERVALPAFDVQIPSGSLQMSFRNRATDFPTSITALEPDPDRVSTWRRRLDALGPEPKIGVAWRGGVLPQMKRKKSVSLETFSDFLKLPGLTFVNVQYGDCRDELAAAEKELGVTIHDWPDHDPIGDVEGQAAPIAALDLVVQTSNASAHLAGALSVPVWTLVSAAPDWRWQSGGETALWYPSMRLSRQDKGEDWESVAARIRDALIERFSLTP